MNLIPIAHRRCGVTSLFPAAAVLAGALAYAQVPTRPPQPLERAAEPPMPADVGAQTMTATSSEALMFDQPGDGALWARGSAYKARFDGAGATVVPFFGTDAPRDFPLRLSVSQVTSAGAPLASTADAAAQRRGNCVSIDHGSFVEEYRLAADSLEQRFVFPQLDRSGDLVVRMAADSELSATDLGSTLTFGNDLGRIDYGEAFAVDAAGERIALDSVLVDGQIELRVPECFVERATLPLTIDPFVTFFTVAYGYRAEFLSDVSYDFTTDRWCVSWIDIWSSTDYDCYARLIDGTGGPLASTTIDFTTDVWTDAKIANNNGSNVFLVVAVTIPSSGLADIRGRIVDAPSATTGSQFNISPADGIYRNYPDVGGDPYPGGPSYFCVVWQASMSAYNADIQMQLVTPSGALQGGVVPLEDTQALHELPSISNSCGPDIGDNENLWTVVWQQPYSSYDHDIYGAQVHWYGALANAMFTIDYTTYDDQLPSVSSMLDPASSGTPRPYLVVYQRDYGDHDIVARVGQGATVSGSTNLVGPFPSSTWYYDQTAPAVDSDGAKFLVEFEERTSVGAYDANVWMCDYFLSGSTLVPCELRKNFAGSVSAEFDTALHSKASSGGPSGRTYASWTFDTISSSYDVQGGVWDTCVGGLVESFCFGDGSGTACPCGNSGASGHGCANSVNPSGAILTWSGQASLAADTFALHASGMPSTASCLFFQTTGVNAAGSIFGDGLRCASGPPRRFPLKTSSGGAASYPGAGNLPISFAGQVPGAGSTLYYQAWYRDPASYCSPATYNLSNALKVIWAP